MIRIQIVTNLGEGGTYLSEREPIRHTSANLRQHIGDHCGEADRWIEIRAVGFRHRRRPIVTCRNIQEQITIPVQLQRPVQGIHTTADQLGSDCRLIHAIIQREQVRHQQLSGRSVHLITLLEHQVTTESNEASQPIDQVILPGRSQETEVILIEGLRSLGIQTSRTGITTGIYFLALRRGIIIRTTSQLNIEPIGRGIFQGDIS